MLSAKFDRNIEIYKVQNRINVIGSQISDYVFLKFKKAGVTYMGGNTNKDSLGQRSVSATNFTIRYDKEVDYNCRIKYNDSFYSIEHIEIVGRNEAQVIKTELFTIDEG
jgi:head-tail adaptor